MNGDRLIRAATAAVVTAFAAVVSYSHVYDLGRTHGQSGVAARLLPTTGPGKTRLPEAETDDGEPPVHALMSIGRCRFEALGRSPRLDGSSATMDASIECNTPQRRKEEIMCIRFVAKDPDSVPDQSPTLYKTDRDSWLVQGWVVTDPATLAEMNIPEGETVVEIPGRLVPFFREGLVGLRYAEFAALFPQVKREALHLEMRDSYGTEAEIPHLAKWAAGEPDDLGWLQSWCTLVRDATAAGKIFRRARVVSEPLSEYQRWAHSLTASMVDAGEDIRWVPRARVSELMFPGNDFWLFDGELLVFLVFAGNGLVVDRPARTDPDLIARCRASFEAAWALSVPHHEYTPALS